MKTSLPVFNQMTEGNLSLTCKNVAIPGSVVFCFVHGPGFYGGFMAVS